jgi:uncharacterized protein YcbK (DUF882 family)
MKISEHFDSSEWTCRCGCGQLIINTELVKMMERFRKRTGKPVIVHCVNRCENHNEKVGGEDNSKHLTGDACDFHVKGMPMKELHAVALSSEDILYGGIGIYEWGVHADTGKRRIWDNR